MFTCRHPPCGKQFGQRRALGLCSACYRDVEVRKSYQEATNSEAVVMSGMKTRWIPAPVGWENLKPHPLSELTEFGAGIDLEGVAAHMRRHGYDADEAIIIYEGQILDGRHRRGGAVLAGVVPTFKAYEGTDPLAYVLKKAFRQHLTPSQRSLLAAKLATLGEGRPGKETSPNGLVSQPDAANLLNIGLNAVKQGKKVVEQGTEALQEAVKDGTVSVSDAARITSKPAEVQDQAVKDVRDGKARTVSKAVEPEHPPEVEDYGDAYEGPEEMPEDGETVYVPAEPTRPIPTHPKRQRNQPNGVQYLERDLDAQIGVVVRMVNQRSTIYGKDGRFKTTWGYLSKFIDELADWRKEKAQ